MIEVGGLELESPTSLCPNHWSTESFPLTLPCNCFNYLVTVEQLQETRVREPYISISPSAEIRAIPWEGETLFKSPSLGGGGIEPGSPTSQVSALITGQLQLLSFCVEYGRCLNHFLKKCLRGLSCLTPGGWFPFVDHYAELGTYLWERLITHL